jgi:hypothetical protein
MSISRILFFSLVGAALLFGQMPFQVRYCGMMKQAVTADLLQFCRRHHQTSGRQEYRIVAPSGMMQVLAKPTIGAFEKKPHDRGIAESSCREESLQTVPQLTPHLAFAGEVEYPPPDLTIHNLTLRI